MSRPAVLGVLAMAAACQRHPSGQPLHLVYRVDTDKAIERKTDEMSLDLEARLQVPVPRFGRAAIIVPAAVAPRIQMPNLVEVGRDAVKGKVLFGLTPEFARQVEQAAVKQTLDVLQHRFEKLGAHEVRGAIDGKTVTLDVVGLPDIEHARSLARRSAQLDVHLVDDAASDWLASQAAPMPAESREPLERFFADKLPPPGDTVGYQQTADGWRALVLVRRPVLTVTVVKDGGANWLQLADGDARRLTEVSAKNAGKKLALAVDGTVQVVESKFGGRIELAEAKDLVGILRVGSLPAPVEEVAFAAAEEKK